MSGQAQLLPGTLDLLILKAVSLGPLHGYGILLRIGQISAQALLIEQGALYPALFRLVRQGLLRANWGTSDNNRRAKFYELTHCRTQAAAGRNRRMEPPGRGHRVRPGCRTRGIVKLPAYFRSLVANLFQRSRVEDDMEEELRSHVHHRADDLERSGLNRAAAERRARIEFGGRQRFKEEVRDQLSGNFLETLMQDVRYSLRVLRKAPGFTLVAVATLALAIGANGVVFAVLNAVILRPLNVPQAQSLYGVEYGGNRMSPYSYPDYLDLRDRNRSFDGLAAFGIDQAGLDTGGSPARVWVEEVSGNFFDALGIQPYLGRLIHGSDEQGPNSAPYIVLPYAYWQTHFQSDRGVVGRTVQLNKHPFTIVGVTPPGFHGTVLFFSADLFVPIVNHEQVAPSNLLGANVLKKRGSRWIFTVLGHLKTGVTPPQAVADLNSIGAYLDKIDPREHGEMTFRLSRPSLLGDFLGRPARAFVTALMLLAGLILLAACANLGTLFAARAADRSREIALRMALGSSRNRVLRQVFTEAMLISLIGGAAGLAGAILLLRWMSMWQPLPRVPMNLPVSPDGNVYLVALLLSLASGLLFGAVPVRQILRTDPYEIVKSGSISMGRRRVTARDLLLVVQIAICAVLVTASLVAVRGLGRSLQGNFGFEPRNALLVNAGMSMGGYASDQVQAVQKRMLDALRAIPGIASVGLIDKTPLNGDWTGTNVFTDETTDLRPANAAAETFMYSISPEYFRAAHTRLLSGRTFSWHDDNDYPRVAIVNRLFANKVFGSTTKALGRSFKRSDGTRIQVVGIVEDGKYENLTEDPKPAMFLSFLQSPPTSDAWLVIRSNRDAGQLAAAIRSALRVVDPALPLYLQTWNEGMGLVLFPARIATVSLGVLGMLGAMLSITGIFGMAAYSVSKRLKELGIRIAIGAQRKEVLEAALGRAFRLLAVGSVSGLLLGIAASRVLSAIVYQATPRDPLVLGTVVAAMLLLGLVATWIPAQRALSIDPLKLLREE